MIRIGKILLLFMGLAVLPGIGLVGHGQEQPPAKVDGAQQAPEPKKAIAPRLGSTLKLTAPQELDFRPGKLVRVDADGSELVTFDMEVNPAADIDWIVEAKSLAFPMPPPGTTVRIVAAACKGQEAMIAKTTVTVRGGNLPPVIPPGAAKEEAPAPSGPVSGPIKNAFVLYKNGEGKPGTPLARIMTSKALRDGFAARGVNYSDPVDVDDPDPRVKALKFDRIYAAIKGASLVFQDASGNVLPPGQAFRIKATGNPDADVTELLRAADEVNRQAKGGN